MKRCSVIPLGLICFAVIGFSAARAHAQSDPGPRGGLPGAGSYFPYLDANEQNFFNQARLRLDTQYSVSGKLPGEPGVGLGPTFSGNGCTMCHAQPADGGSSPGLSSPQNSVPNPQVVLAILDGATNTVPSFITNTGPVRAARFIKNPNGTLDGEVHGLYTITGRTDAPGCSVAQPDFAQQLEQNNVVFRIPTAVFGLGLVEATPDSVLQANLAATQSDRAKLGIGGAFNTSSNDGTITRFGWKAQNKSLLMFSGEALNVEQGVSNELFPNERSTVAGCVFNSSPEDTTNLINQNPNSGNFGTAVGTASEMSSSMVNFAAFARLSAPPTPAQPNQSAQNGAKLFQSTGCALCHSPTLTTGSSPYTGMSNYSYHPYSDFALHHMGSQLADGIYQGQAGPDQFRTAPLWGLGQRLFFMHDGRETDLLNAIADHADCAKSSRQTGQQNAKSGACSSEANQVVSRFNGLTPTQQQDILNFLRSL